MTYSHEVVNHKSEHQLIGIGVAAGIGIEEPGTIPQSTTSIFTRTTPSWIMPIFFCRGVRQIDDPAARKGAAIIDANGDGTPILQIGDVDPSAEFEMAMSRCHGVHIKPLAAGGAPAMKCPAVVTGQPGGFVCRDVANRWSGAAGGQRCNNQCANGRHKRSFQNRLNHTQNQCHAILPTGPIEYQVTMTGH